MRHRLVGRRVEEVVVVEYRVVPDRMVLLHTLRRLLLIAMALRSTHTR